MKNLQAALLAISLAGGYFYDVEGLAVKLDPNQNVEALLAPDGPRPWLVLEPLPERWEYFPANQLRLVLPITIHWIGLSDPTIDDSRMQTYFRGCADVERAIAIDVTRGGLAVDTRISRRTLDPKPDAAETWAIIETETIIHRTYGAPNG